MILAHPSVYLEINSYAELLESGNALAEWIEEVHQQILIPFLNFLNNENSGKSQTYLYVEPVKGVRNAIYKYNQKNWDLLLGEIRDRKLRGFYFDYKALEEHGSPGLDYISLHMSLLGLEYHDVAHCLVVSVTRPLYGKYFTSDVQHEWVKLAKHASIALHAVTGYITLDHAGVNSPYEDSIGLAYTRAAREFRKKLRGYYWGNFLSQEHILELGGVDRIKQDAPCHKVEELSSGEGNIIYLQLTPDIEDFSDAALRALKNYLKPLLPKGERRPFSLPLRVV